MNYVVGCGVGVGCLLPGPEVIKKLFHAQSR